MKKIIVLLMFLFGITETNAQGFWTIANTVNAMFPNDTSEDGPKAKVNRIKRRWEGQINAQGTFTTAAQNFKNFSAGLVNFRAQTTNCLPVEPQWKEIGPTMELNNPNNALRGAGLIHRMTFHPFYGNPSYASDSAFTTIYAMSGFGGIWKSINDGESWRRLNTDIQIPFSSFGVLVIDPINPQRMYVTTGTPNGAPDVAYYTLARDFPLYTSGIYGTDDGGVNWVSINNGINASLLNAGGSIYNLQLDPTNHNNLIFTSTDGVYVSANSNGALIGLGSILWSKDIDFNFADDKIQGLTYAYNGANLEWYIAGMNIYFCTNPFSASPSVWSLATGPTKNLNLTSGFYQGSSTKKIIQTNIVNSPFQANNMVYSLIYMREPNTSTPDPNDYLYYVAIHKLAVPNISATQWQTVVNTTASTFAGGLFGDKIPFVKSPTGNNFYFGSTHYGSLLGGTFSETYGNYQSGSHHADIQGLYIHPSQPSKLWMASDGGVSVASVLATHNQWGFTYKNKGIQAQLLWDFDDSELKSDYKIASLQDNATMYSGGAAGSLWKEARFNGDGLTSQILDKNANDALIKGSSFGYDAFNINTGILTTPFPGGVGADYYFSDPENPAEKIMVGSWHIARTSGNGTSWFAMGIPNTPNISLNYSSKVYAYSSNPDKKQIFKVTYPRYYGSPIPAYGITNRTSYQETSVANPMPSFLFKSSNGFNFQVSNNDNYFSNVQTITNALYDAAKLANAISTSDLPLLSGVTCKPDDGNKVWVCSSGLNPQFKIWKSIDGGVNWTDADVLDAFVNIPVFDVVAVEGSMDLVFAATLDGVYYTDNTMAGKWCRYGNSPSVQTRALKVNPCKNKLIVTTYGRGAFEVDLPFQPVPSTNISVNTTWTTPQSFPNTSVVVKAGKTLTIQNTTIKFGPNSRLYVEAGAKLVINNATLTSESGCNGYLWLGIELQGDINQKQVLSGGFYPNHGWCVMTNNATIQNAVYGVRNHASINGDGWSIDWAKLGGGVINCTNAKFLNCVEGAKFLPYTNKNALNNPIADKSFFTTCQFLTDALTASHNFIPSGHLVMWGTRGVAITSNTFKNNTPSSYAINRRGNGIVAWDAHFTTGTPCLAYLGSGDCGTYGTRNTFENLHYGVDAGAGLATVIDNINVCTFTNNHRGIILRGTTTSSVFRNNINIGDGYTDIDNTVYSPYGLYLDVCDAYNVKENVFNDATGSAADVDYGIIVSNTGANANVLKQNTFSNVAFGIQAQEANSNLQLKCNKFTAASINSADVKILGDQMPGSIAQQQGGCIPGDATALPGNEFSHTCAAAKDLNTNSNVAYPVTYNTRNSITLEVPQSGCYNLTDFNVNFCNPAPTGVVCSTGGGGGGGSKMAKSNPDKELEDMTALIAAKQQLLDDGNAQPLHNALATNVSEQQLKQNLLQKGPYLSDQVLLALINHLPNYSDATLKEVLEANSPLSASVLAALNTTNMNAKAKGQLNALQNGMSQRTYVESEIKYYTTSRVLLYNQILSNVLNDTTYTNVYDSLYKKLNFSISPQSRNIYVSALVEQNKFTQAQAEVANMRQQGVNAGTCDYLEAMIALKQQPNYVQAYKTNAAISSKLDPLLSTWPLGKSVNALVLNKALFGKGYTEQVYADAVTTKNQRYMQQQETVTEKLVEGNLQVITFPNPANQEINFVVNGITENENCNIIIYDINGRLITELQLTENKTPKTVSLSLINSGIYFYKAISGDKVVQNKLVIIK
jgi:hypothetical protein